jgi:hypothetical protein
MTSPVDFAALMAPVALRLLGAPSEKKGDVWRWGSRGSMKVDVAKGVWFDYEKGEGKGVLALIEREAGVSGAECFRWLEREGLISPLGRNPKLGREVEHYDYRDEHGAILFQVVRYADPKDFRQRRPDGNGGWIWNLSGVRQSPITSPSFSRRSPRIS